MAKGKWVSLTENRRMVLDVCAIASRIPLFPVERRFPIRSVAEARSQAKRRVSWSAVYAKAFALTAIEHPILRQAFVRWPWPHLYQHSFSSLSLAMNRDVSGEDRLCWAKISRLDDLSLLEIQQQIDTFQTLPVEEAFSQQCRLSRLPAPVRRAMLGFAMNLSGRQRAKSFGTFTMSSLAGQQAINRFHPSILTTSLTYGPVEADGTSLITLICDHRVIDGYRAAVCLNTLFDFLCGDVLAELESLQQQVRAA